MDPILAVLIEDNSPDVVAVFYHPHFPNPADPFHLHNQTQNTARVDYYSVSDTPRPIFDGVLTSNPPYILTDFQADLDARLQVATSVGLEIQGHYSQESAEVEVSVIATTDQPLPAGDWRMHIVLTESGIYFDGTGIHDIHDHTMREMFPDPAGTAVAFAGPLPQSASAGANVTIDGSYVRENCRVVCFLQENETREVLQAAAVFISDLPPVTAAESVSWSQVKSAFSAPR